MNNYMNKMKIIDKYLCLHYYSTLSYIQECVIYIYAFATKYTDKHNIAKINPNGYYDTSSVYLYSKCRYLIIQTKYALLTSNKTHYIIQG